MKLAPLILRLLLLGILAPPSDAQGCSVVETPLPNSVSLRIKGSCTVEEVFSLPSTDYESLHLIGDPGASIDLAFRVNHTDSVNVFIESLVLLNAILGTKYEPTWPAFFVPGRGALELADVQITTDCFHLFTFGLALKGNELRETAVVEAEADGFIYVKEFDQTSGLSLRSVNVTCGVPTISPPPWNSSGPAGFLVTNGLELLNAVSSVQLGIPSFDVNYIYLVTNVSLAGGVWKDTIPVTTGMTIQGNPDEQTVLDFYLLTLLMHVVPGGWIKVVNIFCMNLSPLRGKMAANAGTQPLYSYVFWPITADNSTKTPPVVFTDSTWLLPRSEYSYMEVLALMLTTNVPGIKAQAAELRKTFVLHELSSEGSAHAITWSKIQSPTFIGLNLSLTKTPPDAFAWKLRDTNVPAFSFDNEWPDVTQVGVYTTDDFMGVLQDLQDVPNVEWVGIILYRDIQLTAGSNAWPKDGYTLTGNVAIAGNVAKDNPESDNYTTLDIGNTGTFLGSTSYLFYTFIDFVNMPRINNPRTPISTIEYGVMTSLRYNAPVIFVNVQFIIPYSEFSVIYKSITDPTSTVAKSLGIDFKTASYSATKIVFKSANVSYWMMSGVGLTYLAPQGSTLLYENVFFPLEYSPPFPPPEAVEASSDSLSGGAIAGIIVGSVAGVAAIAALMLFFVLRERRKRKAAEGEKYALDPRKNAEGTDTEHFGKLLPKVDGTPKSGVLSSESDPACIKSESSAELVEEEEEEKQPLPSDELSILMKSLESEMDDVQLVLLDVLGKGGFGVVYKGLWKGLLVAVKTLIFQDKMFGDGRAQQTAILEAAISTSLSHTNVVTTYSHDIRPLTVRSRKVSTSHDAHGSGPNSEEPKSETSNKTGLVSDWKLYIIQEYCSGGTLRQATLKRRFWDEERLQPRLKFIFESAYEVASGLAHLHSKNIIHGDLNLNNVLLKKDESRGKNFLCKLADFGLSIKMGAGQSHVSNMRRGTPFYTAPEVMHHGNMTKAADVFSFGVIMWEMLHSMMCYKTTQQGQFLPRDIFPTFPSKCPKQYTDLATLCMSPEFKARPQMTEVVDVMGNMLELLKQGSIGYGQSLPGKS